MFILRIVCSMSTLISRPNIKTPTSSAGALLE